MFRLIRKIFAPSMYDQKDAGPTKVDVAKMVLEERILWRREMVYNSIRDTMHSIEVISKMYKFKAIALDERGHSYIVMIDVSKDFAIGKRITIKGFSGIEEKIYNDAFSKYGITVVGVYWRTNDAVNVFSKIHLGQHEDFLDTVPMPYIEHRIEKRPVFEEVSLEEKQAFMAAIAAGTKPPVIHVGRKEYQSDLAPLAMMDGTDFNHSGFADTTPGRY